MKYHECVRAALDALCNDPYFPDVDLAISHLRAAVAREGVLAERHAELRPIIDEGRLCDEGLAKVSGQMDAFNEAAELLGLPTTLPTTNGLNDANPENVEVG